MRFECLNIDFRTAFSVVLFGLFMTMPGFGDEQADILKKLEASFSEIKTVQTAFTQEKTLKMFDRTIELKGRLAIENPGRLAWRIDSPIRYVLVMDDKQVLQWDEDSNKVDRMKTAGDPMFEEVLGQIEMWFSGQFSALVNDHDLTIEPTAPLHLIFVPKESNLSSKAIKQVDVVIRDDMKYVEQISIEDVTGDMMVIRFHETVLNAAISADEWKVVADDE